MESENLDDGSSKRPGPSKRAIRQREARKKARLHRKELETKLGMKLPSVSNESRLMKIGPGPDFSVFEDIPSQRPYQTSQNLTTRVSLLRAKHSSTFSRSLGAVAVEDLQDYSSSVSDSPTFDAGSGIRESGAVETNGPDDPHLENCDQEAKDLFHEDNFLEKYPKGDKPTETGPISDTLRGLKFLPANQDYSELPERAEKVEKPFRPFKL